MKSRSVLTQIEFTIMILIFAVSAAVCLKIFTYADTYSERNAEKNNAQIILQSSAELIKSESGNFALCAEISGGEADESSWVIIYDDGSFMKAVRVASENPLLGKAKLQFCKNNETISALEIAWQEENA